MFKKIAVISLLLTFVIACDDNADAGEDDEQPEVVEPEEEAAEPAEPEEEPEGPRANETETPSDDEIGELPEGVGLAVGESMPDVSAKNSDDEEVRLQEIGDDSSLMVFFYRGGWCPFCNFQIREITEAYEQFSDRGILPVAVSVDQPDKAAETDRAYDIPFPVLADPDLEIHQGFNVTFEADEEEVEQLAGFGIDLEAASGRDHNTFAIPGVFIIDSDGTVTWAHANLDYRVRPSVEQLLSVIDGLD